MPVNLYCSIISRRVCLLPYSSLELSSTPCQLLCGEWLLTNKYVSLLRSIPSSVAPFIEAKAVVVWQLPLWILVFLWKTFHHPYGFSLDVFLCTYFGNWWFFHPCLMMGIIMYLVLSSVYTTTIAQNDVTVTPLHVTVMSSTTVQFNIRWNWTLDINIIAFMTVPIELVGEALLFGLD